MTTALEGEGVVSPKIVNTFPGLRFKKINKIMYIPNDDTQITHYN